MLRVQDREGHEAAAGGVSGVTGGMRGGEGATRMAKMAARCETMQEEMGVERTAISEKGASECNVQDKLLYYRSERRLHDYGLLFRRIFLQHCEG